MQTFEEKSVDPPVHGFIHRPERSNHQGLIFTHGAGGNAKAGLPLALAEAFADAGFTVLRCNLPFRQTRPFGPPRPNEAARDQAGLRNAVLAMRKLVSGRVFLGGQSYGGRQATMLCAREHDLVDGLLLTSYPLHPPGKPDKLRVQHFPELSTPAMFVSGSRDPFGTIEEIKEAITVIPAKTKLVPAEGVGHDLGFSGKKKSAGLPAKIVEAFQELMGR
jgi:predicted alpha/beta-hydrolase family hydrolase